MANERVELEKELTEIRKEVIEARNLVIKTDNLLKNLHAEVKAVGKRQEDFQKRQWISSGATYIGFAVLCVTGAVMISGARSSSANQERSRLEKSLTEITQQLEKQKADQSATLNASRAANEAYRMMTTLPGDERLKGIDASKKLDKERLTALEKEALSDRSEILRKEIGQSVFERGKNAFRRNEMTNAVTELSRFMEMNPTKDDELDAAFFLGTAYNHTKKYDLSVPLLQKFVNENKRSKQRDYAMLMLAHSLEQTGQFEKAIEVARDALGTYPNSEFGPTLRLRLSTAKRAMNAAAGGTPTGPGDVAQATPAAGQGGAGQVAPAGGAAAAPARTPLKPGGQ
jgi:TolA-binding protein